MFNGSQNTVIALILVGASGILAWGYNRARNYGRLGILAWLQSVALMAPWLLFFGLAAGGIYLNFGVVLLLLLASILAYIVLGKKLRLNGQNVLLQEKAAERLKNLELENQKTEEILLNAELLPIPSEDLSLIKSIFGIDTFFATETISYQEGAIFKGNLRIDPAEAYSKLSAKLKAQSGDKYRLFLVEGPENKPVVIILPSSKDPVTTTLAQKNLALVLFLATLATSLETSGLLLGFDLAGDWGRYAEALPISLGLWLILGIHELGHWWMANRHQVRLSIPFFLPSLQIGAFGSITRFESLLSDRLALFDVSFAGPLFGGLTSLVLLLVGLVLSHPGSTFQIPTQFFQGSILVGTIAKVILGSEMNSSLVDINPLALVGWLGLVVTALNLMPAGQLDGGRIIQAIYGRRTARRTTIATLIVLGIVAVVSPGNPIPLYWGIVILFLQRELERPSLNELTEVDDTRAILGIVALFFMLATLIPLSPSLAKGLGIGI